MSEFKNLSNIYYSPKGFWKGLEAMKKLAKKARVSEDAAKLWLMKQAIWQIYLPAPKHVLRPKFDVTPPKVKVVQNLILIWYQKVFSNSQGQSVSNSQGQSDPNSQGQSGPKIYVGHMGKFSNYCIWTSDLN